MGFNNQYCNCNNCIVRSLVFEFMNDEMQQKVCNSKKELSYNRGEIIIKEGSPIEDFAYIKEGLVKLHQSKNGSRDSIIYIAKPFDFITVLTVFSETKYKYSITAIEKTDVCFFKLEQIRSMALNNAAFGFGLIRKMSSVSDKIINSYTEINQKNIRGRIAFILLMFANDIYGKPKFKLPILRKELAQLIGMTTENVIRILSEFSKDGIIKIRGKEIEIIKPEWLKTISEKG